MFDKHCKTEFIKHVLPKFYSPVSPILILDFSGKKVSRDLFIFSSSESLLNSVGSLLSF